MSDYSNLFVRSMISQIFLFGSHTAANMTLRLIGIQNLSHLRRQSRIDHDQTFHAVFMYCTFTDAEFPGSLSHCCIALNNIIGNVDRSFFYIVFQQKKPLKADFYILCTALKGYSCYPKKSFSCIFLSK